MKPHETLVLEVKWQIWLVTWLGAELSCRSFGSRWGDLWVKWSMWQENKGWESLLNRQHESVSVWCPLYTIYTQAHKCAHTHTPKHTHLPAYNPIKHTDTSTAKHSQLGFSFLTQPAQMSDSFMDMFWTQKHTDRNTHIKHTLSHLTTTHTHTQPNTSRMKRRLVSHFNQC